MLIIGIFIVLIVIVFGVICSIEVERVFNGIDEYDEIDNEEENDDGN